MNKEIFTRKMGPCAAGTRVQLVTSKQPIIMDPQCDIAAEQSLDTAIDAFMRRLYGLGWTKEQIIKQWINSQQNPPNNPTR